eukprot:9616565-Heterocapsa_arctica.AAC.1
MEATAAEQPGGAAAYFPLYPYNTIPTLPLYPGGLAEDVQARDQLTFDPQAVAEVALEAWAGVWQACGAVPGPSHLWEARQQTHPLDFTSLDDAALEPLKVEE